MQAPSPAAADAPEWVVACLCAQWCGICRGWHDGFRRLAEQCAEVLPGARWLWVDVEQQADSLGGFDAENFPVLAVQRGEQLLFCAALPQQAGNWRRMIEAAAGLDAGQAQRWAEPLQGLGLDLRRLHDDVAQPD